MLETAHTVPGNYQATWVERCVCPEGYTGLSCEYCAPGYRRDPLGISPYFRCVKCFCHNHADTCDPDTGKNIFCYFFYFYNLFIVVVLLSGLYATILNNLNCNR